MANWLVTGGAGFIGSHLVDALCARGEVVRVVDNLVTGLRGNVPPEVEFVEGDVADAGIVSRAVVGCDYVLHQAAIPSVPRSVADPAGSNRANINGSLNVLLAARDAGCRRVVFAGSSSVYGDSPVLPKHEALAPQPQSPYALQKLVGEQYGQIFTRLYGLETVSIRYFNVFGPRQTPASSYSGVISLFVRAALEGEAPSIFGDGLQTRDFTYIDNVVDGVLRAATATEASGEVINVATGGRVSLIDLWEAIGRLVGPTKPPTFRPVRDGDVRDSQADIQKAARLLGYQPTVAFEEGLQRTVEWFKGQGTRGLD